MADGPLSAPVMTELERLRIEAGNAAAHWTRSLAEKQRADRAEAALALLSTDDFRYSLHDWIETTPMRSRTDMVTDLLWEIRLRLDKALKATAVNRSSVSGGTSPAAAVAPTGPGGGRPETPAAESPVDLSLAVGETIDVFIDSQSDGRPSVVTAVGETCLLARVPRVGEMQIPLSAAWWRRRGKESAVPLPAGGQIGRAP